jgi:NAD(P)-dependent dehydrogenase (short-subunit alcohol dehydrogenase family)
MYDDLRSKTALVTGSGKRTGLGFAIAEKLAACGMNIIIADLGHPSDKGAGVKTGTWDEMDSICNELQDAFSVATLPVELDVTSSDSVANMTERVKEKFEIIDLLVNNAGAALGVPNEVRNYDESAWMKTIDVNLHGTFRVSKAILPMMTGNGGSIVNMASRAGKVPPLFNGAYGVAKAGVIMLSKVMALELAGQGIRVNAVCPGLIMTDMQEWRINLEAEVFSSTFNEREDALRSRVPVGRLGVPGDVASLVAYLASSESSFITGQAINICGGETMEL